MNDLSPSRKRVAVFKFSSCDGCQLSLLSCEDELLALSQQIEFAHFLEASSKTLPGPFDLSLVEGSISTAANKKRIQDIRDQSRVLVAIGACATAGGIQALRNWANHDELKSLVYPNPDYIETLATSTAISTHVHVDFELQGCPIEKRQLLEVIMAFVRNRRPSIPGHSVCMDCKRRGVVCLSVARSEPCLGPITQAGCGAICPAYGRGCYGCFGPAPQANCQSLTTTYRGSGASKEQMVAAIRGINAGAKLFQIESDRLQGDST